MILATDEVFTYAIFNYANIQWTSHTEAGGDTTGGEGGTPAYVSNFDKNSIYRCNNFQTRSEVNLYICLDSDNKQNILKRK